MMFRKFHDRVTAAASAAIFGSTAAASVEESNLQRLVALGFSESQATSALQQADGNVDRAAELLLVSHPTPRATATATTTANTAAGFDWTRESNGDEDADATLQRVLDQSLQEHLRPQRTAAMNKAEEAAVRRAAATTTNTTKTAGKPKRPSATSILSTLPKSAATTTPTNTTTALIPKRASEVDLLLHHHPAVKLIPKLQDKSVEEQILRTADRMKNYPAAVDTLYKVLTAIYRDPDSEKFRTIDTTTAGYQRSVANVPGASDFFGAMQFEASAGVGVGVRDDNHRTLQNPPALLVLPRPLYDPALVYLGVSALEQVRQTPEYTSAKEQWRLVRDLAAILHHHAAAHVTPDDARGMAAYLAQCPAEPAPGRGAFVQVQWLPDGTVRRRFDSDDTVRDVLHWLAGTLWGRAGWDRLCRDPPSWCLVDVNHAQRAVIDVQTQMDCTLQSMGCWPSGRLQVQPVLSSRNHLGKENNTEMYGVTGGLSRGLASGTSSEDE